MQCGKFKTFIVQSTVKERIFLHGYKNRIFQRIFSIFIVSFVQNLETHSVGGSAPEQWHTLRMLPVQIDKAQSYNAEHEHDADHDSGYDTGMRTG